jgi:Family of unknown function (DUF6339)
MNKLKFLKQPSLDRLQANIASNQNRYAGATTWLDSYFTGSNWFVESNIVEAASIQLQPPTSKTDLFDLENTRIVYTALRHITPVQASDPRLWAYLTHVTHWEYMRERWPIEQYLGKPRLREIIQERYFFMPDRSRALIRNGMARLWWYGYCSYDEMRDDPFELTSALLKNLDVTQSILERAFSRNTMVTKVVLSVLLDCEKEGKAFYVREKVRDLAKYIVQIGGVTIIDALDEPELRDLVTGKINQLTEAATA